METTIIAKIRKVVHPKSGVVPGNFCILASLVDQREITFKGIIHEAGSPVGLTYTFTGIPHFRSYFDNNFNFSSYELQNSTLFFFLTRTIKGLGEKKAQALINKFGDEQLENILTDEPALLLKENGIKGKKLGRIISSWQQFSVIKSLSQFLLPHGINAMTIQYIYNHFGANSLHIIQENPYILTDIPDIDFKTADRIALNVGGEVSSEYRIKFCISYLINRIANHEGETVINTQDLVGRCVDELEIPDSEGVVVKVVSVSPSLVELAHGLITSRFLYNTESSIRERLQHRMRLPKRPLHDSRLIEQAENKMGFPFSLQQKQAIQTVIDGHSTVLVCGYAGTGKSTIAKAILQSLETKYHKNSMICMALSGIAAERIQTTTGYTGSTIHSALRYANGKFDYCRENKLPYKVILVDEASMINIELFKQILDAVCDDAILVVMGDDAQLPPIGAGNPFADLLRSESIPSVMLNKIYRQSEDSVLALFANQIREGLVPEDFTGQNFTDFQFISKESHSVANEIVEQAVKYSARSGVQRCQVLSPKHSGQVGVVVLNKMLQTALNPTYTAAITGLGVEFRTGDKVIHLKNKDMQVVSNESFKVDDFERTAQTQRINNGNIGTVVNIDDEDGYAYIQYKNGWTVRYDKFQIGDIINLAYCVTVHKSQGNEFDYIIMSTSSEHQAMLNNQLLYTGLTRGKKKTVVIGQTDIFITACQSTQQKFRKTVLNFLQPSKKKRAEPTI